MKRIDVTAVSQKRGSGYPAPHDAPCNARVRQALGEAAGLSQFGVNLMRLPPGAWSSQRHWHSAEDEFIWILEGEVVLVTDDGEETLRAGDCAGFQAGTPNAHHLQNRSAEPAMLLEVGTRHPERDVTSYAEADLRWSEATGYTRKDGSPP